MFNYKKYNYITPKEIQSLWSQGLGEEYCINNPRNDRVLDLKDMALNQLIIGFALLVVMSCLLWFGYKLYYHYCNELTLFEKYSKMKNSGRYGPLEVFTSVMCVMLALFTFLKSLYAFYSSRKLFKRQIDDSLNFFKIKLTFREKLLQDAFEWGVETKLIMQTHNKWVLKNKKYITTCL